MKETQWKPKGGKSKKYSYEFKTRVVKENLEDKTSLNILEKKYNINDSVVFNRGHLYLDAGEDSLRTMSKASVIPLVCYMSVKV